MLLIPRGKHISLIVKPHVNSTSLESQEIQNELVSAEKEQTEYLPTKVDLPLV